MNLTQDVVILSVNTYDFIDKETKEPIKGTSVWYYQPSTHENTESSIGVRPLKKSFVDNVEYINKFKGLTFPVNATALITLDMKNNKIKVTDFDIPVKK